MTTTQKATQEQYKTAGHCNCNEKPENISNLSPATLAKIAEVRDEETNGNRSKKMADRHVKAIIGLSSGYVALSYDIDFTQMNIVHNGIRRVRNLLSMMSENITHKMFDDYEGEERDGAVLDIGDANRILDVLRISEATLSEVRKTVAVLCAE